MSRLIRLLVVCFFSMYAGSSAHAQQSVTPAPSAAQIVAQTTPSAPAQKQFSMRIMQYSKVVTPDSKGITHLRKAPFELNFGLNFKVDEATPVVKLHLSTDSNYYDTIRSGKPWPFAFVAGALDMAEPSEQTSDDLVVFGNMPVYKVEIPPHPNGPSHDQPVVGVHLLVSGRFNSCTTDSNGVTCNRKVLKLAVGKDNDDRVVGFPVVVPEHFPDKAIYVSAVSFDLPKEERERASATAIIRFER